MRQSKEERKEEQPAKAASIATSQPTRPLPSSVASSSSASSLSTVSGRRDFRWLLQHCESVSHDSSAMTAVELASSALQLLQTNKRDEQLQSELLDLLGMEAIELVGELLQHRLELRKAARTDVERAPSPQPVPQSSAPRVAGPQLLGVSVTSQRAKDAAKAQRKEDRRMARLTAKDTSAEFVARQQQADAERLDEQARSLDQWRSAAVAEKSTALPAGSKRTEHKGYEEVYIPPTLPAQYDREELVPVAALDSWARPVFGSTTHLNRIQSKCYQAAYKHNNNLLVAAPTGAGKCFARGTLLRLFNGDTIAVEDIVGGEQLMGDDGLPRTVTPGTLVHHIPKAVREEGEREGEMGEAEETVGEGEEGDVEGEEGVIVTATGEERPAQEIVCVECGRDEHQNLLLLCDGCDDAAYHTYCLYPPTRAVPAGQWYCGNCIGSDVSDSDSTTDGMASLSLSTVTDEVDRWMQQVEAVEATKAMLPPAAVSNRCDSSDMRAFQRFGDLLAECLRDSNIGRAFDGFAELLTEYRADIVQWLTAERLTRIDPVPVSGPDWELLSPRLYEQARRTRWTRQRQPPAGDERFPEWSDEEGLNLKHSSLSELPKPWAPTTTSEAMDDEQVEDEQEEEEQAEGEEESLYRITPKWEGAKPFTVNGAHILVLTNNSPPCVKERSGDSGWEVKRFEVSTDNRMVERARRFRTQASAQAHLDAILQAGWEAVQWEPTVEQFLASTGEARRLCKLIACKPITFNNPLLPSLQHVLTVVLNGPPSLAQVEYMAWWLGMWVADGTGAGVQISQGGALWPDPHNHEEIWAELLRYRRLFNEPVTQAYRHTSSAGWEVYGFNYGSGSVAGRVLRAYGLINNKHVSRALICDSIDVRRRFLAGLIDGDGWYCADKNYYELAAKRRRVVDGYKELAATLGLRNSGVQLHDCKNQQTGEMYRGHRINLSGDMWDVVQYCVATYKRCPEPGSVDYVERNKDSRCYGFTVTNVGEGEYFGFGVHGGINRRFLLADYTVTHNVSLRTFSQHTSSARLSVSSSSYIVLSLAPHARTD